MNQTNVFQCDESKACLKIIQIVSFFNAFPAQCREKEDNLNDFQTRLQFIASMGLNTPSIYHIDGIVVSMGLNFCLTNWTIVWVSNKWIKPPCWHWMNQITVLNQMRWFKWFLNTPTIHQLNKLNHHVDIEWIKPPSLQLLMQWML